jgi:ribonuclease P protein component
LQCGVAVSSRNFKKAVSRNRVKRIVREVYRLQKLPLQNLLKEQDKYLIVFIIYVGKELPVFYEVNGKMEIALQQLVNVVQKQPQ